MSPIGSAFLRLFSLWSTEVKRGFNVSTGGVGGCFADSRDDLMRSESISRFDFDRVGTCTPAGLKNRDGGSRETVALFGVDARATESVAGYGRSYGTAITALSEEEKGRAARVCCRLIPLAGFDFRCVAPEADGASTGS